MSDIDDTLRRLRGMAHTINLTLERGCEFDNDGYGEGMRRDLDDEARQDLQADRAALETAIAALERQQDRTPAESDYEAMNQAWLSAPRTKEHDRYIVGFAEGIQAGRRQRVPEEHGDSVINTSPPAHPTHILENVSYVKCRRCDGMAPIHAEPALDLSMHCPAAAPTPEDS